MGTTSTKRWRILLHVCMSTASDKNSWKSHNPPKKQTESILWQSRNHVNLHVHAYTYRQLHTPPVAHMCTMSCSLTCTHTDAHATYTTLLICSLHVAMIFIFSFFPTKSFNNFPLCISFPAHHSWAVASSSTWSEACNKRKNRHCQFTCMLYLQLQHLLIVVV